MYQHLQGPDLHITREQLWKWSWQAAQESGMVESGNPRMVWVGKGLRAPLIPPPSLLHAFTRPDTALLFTLNPNPPEAVELKSSGNLPWTSCPPWSPCLPHCPRWSGWWWCGLPGSAVSRWSHSRSAPPQSQFCSSFPFQPCHWGDLNQHKQRIYQI